MEKKQELRKVFKPYEVASFTGEYSGNFITMLDVLHNAINESVVKAFYTERKNSGNNSYVLKKEDIPNSYDVNIKDLAIEVKGKHKNSMEKINYIYEKCVEEIKNKQNWVEMPVNDQGDERKTFVVISGLASTQNGISISISPEYRSLLVEWINRSKNFILYPLKDTLNMTSKYSKKLYPILKRWVESKAFEFSEQGTLNGQDFTFVIGIEEFKELLDIPKTYRLSHIKDLCDDIVKDIDNNTEYTVEVQYNFSSEGVGRPRITHIAWDMIEKATEKLDSKLVKILRPFGKDKDIPIIIQLGQSYGCSDSEIVECCEKTASSSNMLAEIVNLYLKIKDLRGLASLSERLSKLLDLDANDKTCQLIIDVARSSSFELSDDDILDCCGRIKLPNDNLIASAITEFTKYSAEKKSFEKNSYTIVDSSEIDVNAEEQAFGIEVIDKIKKITGESTESVKKIILVAEENKYSPDDLIELSKAADLLDGLSNIGGFIVSAIRKGVKASDIKKSSKKKNVELGGQVHFEGERVYSDEFFEALMNGDLK